MTATIDHTGVVYLLTEATSAHRKTIGTEYNMGALFWGEARGYRR